MPNKILLVEDDPFLIDIYKTKLEESGFSVEVADDGLKAINKAQEGEFDLIILDIVLPQIDGWEILRKIKSEEKTKNAKVVILSNLGQKEEVEKGLNLGATRYLIKANFTPSELIEKIQETLN